VIGRRQRRGVRAEKVSQPKDAVGAVGAAARQGLTHARVKKIQR
jgi:hypothetical protein